MTTLRSTDEIVADMYADFLAGGGGAWSKDVAYVVKEARAQAKDYHHYGTAYVLLQPGNSTAYKMVLHDLVRPIALELAEQFDHDDDGLDAYRVTAYEKSMAAMLGGELLVSLPENFGGRSMVVGLPAMLVPDYVSEVFGCGLNDATVLAVFLTAFSDELDGLRAGVATGAEDHNQPHVFSPDPHLLGKFCKVCALPAKNKRHAV